MGVESITICCAAGDNGPGPAATQPAPLKPKPPVRTGRPAPPLTPQMEFTQRFGALVTRYVRARGAITRSALAARGEELPADVRDACDRALAKRKTTGAALTENTLDEAEKELKAMDDAVTEMENYVKK